MVDKTTLIRSLGLTPHIEGGYFKRTFQSELKAASGQRAMSSIYYLLTDDAPTGYFHQNKSDIIHFFHLGSPIEYTMVSPEGILTKEILGPDINEGHHLQLLVRGGDWKASRLLTGSYGLISESVCPGFEYSDMRMASEPLFNTLYPSLLENIKHLIKPASV